MNLPKIVRDIKRRIETAPNRLALTILIWLENEPSHERALLPPSASELHGPYVRYNESDNDKRHLAEKKTTA